MRSFLACIAILASALPTLAEGFSPDDPLYRDIKLAEEAMFDGKAFPMWPEDIRDIENLTFDLIHCGSPIYQTDISSDRTEIGLESVAHWVTYWKRNLARIGFPKDIWLPIVDGLEKEALARLPAESIEHPDHDGSSIAIVDYDRLAPLLAALDRYRAEKDRKLPPVVADGACGDGLVEVRYALVPPEGTLFVLSEIRFQLCKVKGLDPSDRTACDRWEIAGDHIVYAAGRFRYMVEWTDGTTTEGTLPTIFEVPADENEAITIRKNDG